MHKSSLIPMAAFICAAAIPQALAQTKIKAADLVVNGESFFAMSNITSELTRLARQDGYINANESFRQRSEEHTSELQSRENLVCRLLLEKKQNTTRTTYV